jgi:hypothetical protein
MKKKELGVTNLIGVLLLVVAVVSAGGLYYLAAEYCRISDTLVSVDTLGTDITVFHDNVSGQYQIVVTLTVSNPSELDIEIYSIEYLVFADRTTATLTGYDAGVGGGSSGLANGTVSANTVRDLTVMYLVGPGSLYFERLEYALAGGNSTWMYLSGFALFRLSDYQEVDGELDMLFLPREVVVNG